MHKLIAAASLLALAGCATPEQIAADRCAGYGYSPGSEAYANCIMTVAEARRDRMHRAIGDATTYKPTCWRGSCF